MTLAQPLELIGAPGSPYTRKMLALLRYRGVPYRVRWGRAQEPPPGYPPPRVALLPTVYFPGSEEPEVAIDSTPIIRRLEDIWPGRAAVPPGPGLAFLDALVEDYADEWLTKAMFHYRWTRPQDIAHASPLLIYSNLPRLDSDSASSFAQAFAKRQVGRLGVVGSNATTAPTIEDSYRRLLSVLDGLIEGQGFVLGRRPASSDFGLFGQLTQLAAVDPTPSALCMELSPRVRGWVDRMEDLSGLEPTPEDWLPLDDALDHLAPLLHEIGRVYVPFLVANAQAAADGAQEWSADIDGRVWTQPTFPYQVKCWRALRAQVRALPEGEAAPLRSALDAAGCSALLG